MHPCSQSPKNHGYVRAHDLEETHPRIFQVNLYRADPQGKPETRNRPTAGAYAPQGLNPGNPIFLSERSERFGSHIESSQSGGDTIYRNLLHMPVPDTTDTAPESHCIEPHRCRANIVNIVLRPDCGIRFQVIGVSRP